MATLWKDVAMRTRKRNNDMRILILISLSREAPTLWAGGGLSLIGAERPPYRRLRRNLEQKQNNQA